jgi:hypothetical protein
LSQQIKYYIYNPLAVFIMPFGGPYGALTGLGTPAAGQNDGARLKKTKRIG